MKTNGVRAHLLFLLSFTVVTSGWADLAIMPVGDSITEGAHSNCGGYRYPLYVFLTKAGIGIHFVGQSSSNCSSLPMDMRHHNGYSGADISDIQNNLFGNPGAKTMEMCVPNQGGYWMTNGEDSGKAVIPDVILLMIGTNNILHHPQDADPKNFEPLYKNLVAWFLNGLLPKSAESGR